MGWPKGKSRKKPEVVKSENSRGEAHLIGLKKNPRAQVKTGQESLEQDAIKAKNEAIEREKSKVITKKKPGKELFPVSVEVGNEPNSWISTMMADFFGFTTCGFKENVKRWDFPKAIGDPYKRHIVYRQYFYKQIMVDVFDKKTPVKEILRIKAHLEKLGFTYTYVIGGEEAKAEIIFGERLIKTPKKILEKVIVPKSLEQAGFAGHQIEKR